MARFLGIDAGTTAIKAGVFDEGGHVLGIDGQEYQLLTPAPSLVEMDPETYWRACCNAVRNAVRRSGTNARDISTLCISSQGETLIPVDSAGVPTRRAIVWLDNRAAEEARLISDRFDIADIYQRTGQPEVTPTWPACKGLWIRRNEPEVFADTDRFLLLEDYLLFRLTSQYVTELSLQSSSLMLDVQKGAWWEPMLDFIGISPKRLPRLAEPGSIVGPLSEDGAAAVGLTTRTVAVSGALDQAMCAVGAGNVIPGVVTEATGGALAILATLDGPRYDPSRRVPLHYHALRDGHCLLPWGQTAGMALRWFRDQFYCSGSYEIMTGMAAEIPAGSDGLIVLPHLEGAACPEFNPAARAVFYGAMLRHTRAHFVRALMESVAYMLKKNLDLVEQIGVRVSEIRSTGGGARSSLWLRIKADVLQKPVMTVEVEEVACLGAALLSAVAVGAYPGIDEAAQQMVRLRDRVEPGQDDLEAYSNGYRQYLELYDRLAPMFR